MTLTDADVEAIERATVSAVAPTALLEAPGWLLPMDRGTVGRAKSAVPLSHGRGPEIDELRRIVDTYAAHACAPQLRLPDVPAFAAARAHLSDWGFSAEQATLTQVHETRPLADMPVHADVRLETQPDAQWMAMYLGPGLDPVDGASRAASLARAEGTLFASLRRGGQTLACGAASYGHGWLGIHGMRTDLVHRGKGLAGALVQAMAVEAVRRNCARAYLQVDASNSAALSAYRRMGFQAGWAYAYWKLPSPHASRLAAGT